MKIKTLAQILGATALIGAGIIGTNLYNLRREKVQKLQQIKSDQAKIETGIEEELKNYVQITPETRVSSNYRLNEFKKNFGPLIKQELEKRSELYGQKVNLEGTEQIYAIPEMSEDANNLVKYCSNLEKYMEQNIVGLEKEIVWENVNFGENYENKSYNLGLIAKDFLSHDTVSVKQTQATKVDSVLTADLLAKNKKVCVVDVFDTKP